MTNLNALVRDENTIPVQVASRFVTIAPITYSSGTTAITVPDGAVEMIISPTTDIKISETGTFTAYDLIVANSKEAIGCARMDTIYITQSSSGGTAYVRFSVI